MKTILIADDSPSVRQVVGLTLRGAGYAVVEAEDGQAALQQAAANTIDGVITDLNMPQMDGLEFIRRYRATEKGSGVPIVFLSTESDDAIRQQARQAGALGWMIKPFKPEQLIAVVKKVVG